MSSGFWDSLVIEKASCPTFWASISLKIWFPIWDEPADVSDLKIPSKKALVAVSLEFSPFVFHTKTFDTFEEQ